MSDQSTFSEFVQRIRGGDQQAAVELVRRYEPLIRRSVRLKLEDQRLCRLFDSMDICQSVLASFFVRTAAGQYDLERPEQLVNLLLTMTRNKLAENARRQNRQRRDQRRIAGGAEELAQVADAQPNPGDVVAGEELLRRFRESLSEEERQLADLRSQGMGWTDIAAQLGGTPQGRRMQLTRAVDRVSRQLGIDDDGQK
jgi:RNA polymerase sigma-70 factor (ECF subfamily)